MVKCAEGSPVTATPWLRKYLVNSLAMWKAGWGSDARKWVSAVPKGITPRQMRPFCSGEPKKQMSNTVSRGPVTTWLVMGMSG